ncbi:unnamed protein product [Clonostachys chloroleuca]|uniref:Uncharacterized protein n=1 Tax=Clonostachys chloroleuca TaxID=1926264 RepID=A0AA35LWB4_9HYPO|nr:unnamed protein product [Clonostachys chloroleuca]
MCTNQVALCHFCLFQRHVSWKYCRNFLKNLIDHIQSEDTMTIDILACPIEECESTRLAVIKRAQMAVEAERIRKIREAQILAETRRRDEFARRYLRPKQPVQPKKQASLLTKALERRHRLEVIEESQSGSGTPDSVAALSYSDDTSSTSRPSLPLSPTQPEAQRCGSLVATFSQPRTYVKEAFLLHHVDATKGMGKESFF